MKISKNQLKKIIKSSINESIDLEDIHLTMDVPKRQGFTFTVKAKGTKVDAFFEDETGEIYKISDSEEDKQKLLGVLVSTLATAKKETKNMLLKLLARLFGDSEEEQDLIKINAKVATDRMLASYRDMIEDPKTKLV